MADRTRDVDRDDPRSFGGVPRDATHPAYPSLWMRDENMRQGFQMDRHPKSGSEGAAAYPPSDRAGAFEPSRGRYYGVGPKGYRRSDARLLEEISDRLMAHPDVDASDIEVRVERGIAILSGTVATRHEKRIAEYIAEDVMGVDDVNNQLKVRHGFWASLSGESAAERELPRATERDVAARSAAPPPKRPGRTTK